MFCNEGRTVLRSNAAAPYRTTPDQKQSHGSRGGVCTKYNLPVHEIIDRCRYGKSTYLEHLILDAAGRSVFLDPHGNSAERIADTMH
jgi:hypothetical protein